MASSPVARIATDPEDFQPQEGTALCLSGGGYRAMLFHLGSLWRLYEVEQLGNLKRISSVSGGSITAAVLALRWRELSFTPASIRQDFVPLVVEPLRALADVTIDAHSIFWGATLPGSAGDRIAAAYDEYLFKGATLQALPNEPRFVINATNVQSGALWRFMKPAMRDYRVGEVPQPTIRLSLAVAASSAFPPALSPVEMRLDPRDVRPMTGSDLHVKPYTSRVYLTDGGVYDNLGLETAWKRYQTISVSDGGGKLAPEAEPKYDWARHSYRVLNLVDNQVRALRKRQLIDSFEAGARSGAYWGIRTDINDYELDTYPLHCPHHRTMMLAETPTRLKRMDVALQERLINWGYAVSDAALRKHVDANLAAPRFPYPNSPI